MYFMKPILLLPVLLLCLTSFSQQKKYRLKGYSDSTRIYYSRTANCKMECLKVVEADIRDVLKTGDASYGKARDSAHTDPIYLVEGDTQKNKRIRLVITPKGSALFVITVIPFGERVDCDCGRKPS
jgi:hypothetical protein